MTTPDLKALVGQYHGTAVLDLIPERVFQAFTELVSEEHPEPELEEEYQQGVIDALLTLAGLISDAKIIVVEVNE